MPGGAGRPHLGPPAWGYRLSGTAFGWTLLISPGCRFSLLSSNADKARPAGLSMARAGPPFHRHYDLMLVIAPGYWITDLFSMLH